MRSAWIALAAVAAAACTLKETPSDGGTDAAAETVGDQCAQIAAAVCAAYSMCAISVSDCAANFEATCCSGSTCDELSTTSSSAVQACVAAYDPADCNLLANGIAPSACSGIPQP